MLKQKIQNRVMNSSPYQLIFKKQQEKVSKISADKIDTSPFDLDANPQANYLTCPTEANKIDTDPPSPIAQNSEHNTTLHEYINMLGAVDNRLLDDFSPRRRETYGDANQFFQDSPDLRKAILQEPLEIAETESNMPQHKINTSEAKENSLEMVTLGKESENDIATRNRRPLSMATTTQQLVKSPSGRNQRIDPANDKLTSKVSISKGSFSSSHQKSTTSTTASRTSKNGLDKPGTPVITKSKIESPNKVPPPRLQYKAPELLASTECIRSPKIHKSSNSNSKQLHSPVIKEQKYGLVLPSKSKMERTRQDSTPSMVNSISNLANNTAVYTLKQSSSCVSPSRNVEVLVTPRGNKKVFEVFKQLDIKVEIGSNDKLAPRDQFVGKHKKSNSKPEIPKPKLHTKPVGTKANLYDDIVVEEYDPSEAYLTEFELIVDSLKAKIKENRIEIFEDDKLRAGLMHLKSLASINLAALRDFKA